MAGAVMAEDAGPIMVRNCPRRSRPVDRLATCYTQVVKRPERSLPASRGWSRRMSLYTLAWLLVLLGLPGLYAARRGGWDGWDCRASGLLSPALISSQ
jgi:hypothetical protein